MKIRSGKINDIYQGSECPCQSCRRLHSGDDGTLSQVAVCLKFEIVSMCVLLILGIPKVVNPDPIVGTKYFRGK